MLSCSAFIFFVVTDFFEYEDQDSDLGPSQNLVLPQQQEWEEVSMHMEADILILILGTTFMTVLQGQFQTTYSISSVAVPDRNWTLFWNPKAGFQTL